MKEMLTPKKGKKYGSITASINARAVVIGMARMAEIPGTLTE
jgi:hypothetical protein